MSAGRSAVNAASSGIIAHVGWHAVVFGKEYLCGLTKETLNVCEIGGL